MFGKNKLMRLAERLFGIDGRDCLNLYGNGYKNGLLGKMNDKIEELKSSVKELTEKVEELTAKKVTKKKSKK